MTGINLQDEFPLPDGLVYLNHAGVAPWPRRTATAIERFAEENTTSGPVHYEAWLEVEASLRVQLRALLNAPSSDDIALVKNTSEALSFVAHGLDWRAGDNVVIPDQEFPSNRVVWESLAPQGVEVRQVNLSRGDSPEAALTAAVDRRTRLVSVSSVQYGTGLRLDLATLGAFFHDHRILFCVDAIQSLGALLMDVQHIQADFVMADGHKWLLAPEGLGVFYCRAECRDQLKLTPVRLAHAGASYRLRSARLGAGQGRAALRVRQSQHAGRPRPPCQPVPADRSRAGQYSKKCTEQFQISY